MSTAPDSLSVVICAYTEDRWADLVGAVESVRSQDPRPHEIVVVIDHNPTLLARASERYPGAADTRVVANAESKGLSGARNTGIAVSTGSIVAFLDDDAKALPGWTGHLLEPYANPDILGVGGRVIPRWDDARPAWLPEEFDWVVGCTYAGHREVAGPVRNVIGANMSVRREVFTAIGGFRHSLGRTASLPAGCEETELFIRATQHFPRGTVWYQPLAAVSHRVPPSRARPRSTSAARCFAEGVSKTQIARLVGTQDGLASERAYTTRTLPRALARELRMIGRSRDANGAGRVAALVAGVATTAAGYAAARLPGSDRWLAARNPEPEFVAAHVTTIDLNDGVTDLAPVHPEHGNPYRRAVVLARRDGAPIGVVDVALSDTGLEAAAYAAEIERALGVPVSTHSTADPTRAMPIVAVHERLRAAVVIANRGIGPRACGGASSPSVASTTRRPRSSWSTTGRRAGRPPSSWTGCVGRTRACAPCARSDRASPAPTTRAGARHRADRGVHRRRCRRGSGLAPPPPRRVRTRAPAAGCVTGMIFPLELETAAQGWLEQSAGFNKGFAFEVFTEAGARPDPLFPYTAGTFGSGANMAFRTDVLRSMRGFDPALGAGTRAKGGDDLAAFFDVIAAGHAVAYEPGALVYHQHHRTFEALQRQTFGYGAGLTAYLTKTVLDHPARIVDMLTRSHAPRATP